jgi:hypothetical protein
MDEYNFDEFNETGGRFKQIISLGEKSGFGLSSGFTRANDLVEGLVGVKMFFDKEKNAVAFRFLKTPEEGMVNLKLRPTDKGGYISAQSFIGKYKIDQKKYSGRYTPKEVEHSKYGKIFVIELVEKTAKN